MNVYPFIEAEQARSRVGDSGNVARTCELLEVSRSAFYAHQAVKAAGGTATARTDAELLAEIRRIHAASKGRYGAPRVHAELVALGRRHGRKRVARLMRENGIRGKTPRRWRKTTTPDPAAPARADLINRVFGAGADLDRRWCGDITSWESQRVVTRSAA